MASYLMRAAAFFPSSLANRLINFRLRRVNLEWARYFLKYLRVATVKRTMIRRAANHCHAHYNQNE